MPGAALSFANPRQVTWTTAEWAHDTEKWSLTWACQSFRLTADVNDRPQDLLFEYGRCGNSNIVFHAFVDGECWIVMKHHWITEEGIVLTS